MTKHFLSLAILILITACHSDSNTPNETDIELKNITATLNLTGDAANNRDLPNIDSPIAQLGLKLFFSKTLSGRNDVACASCHHPVLGGGDLLPLSIGIDAIDPDILGPQRQHINGDLNVPRNAPTTFNIGLWDSVLFVDGRVESLGKTPLLNGADSAGIRTPDSAYQTADPNAGLTLTEAQSRFPVTSDQEMRAEFHAGESNQTVRAALAEKLSASENWKDEFAKVYGDPEINYERIARAMGEYERSQVFTNTPWKDYLAGDYSAISESAKSGALLFFKTTAEGGANCASCHSGDFFTDEKFWGLAAPQIGRGKGDGDGTKDFGRFRETKDPNDKYTFRTPTLLNVEVTGPYLHDGAFLSLKDAISHHLDPLLSISNYNPQQTAPANTTHWENNTQEILSYLANTSNSIETIKSPIELSAEQTDDLLEFLKTLTDPCVKDQNCLQDWIADSNDNPDGQVLIMKNL